MRVISAKNRKSVRVRRRRGSVGRLVVAPSLGGSCPPASSPVADSGRRYDAKQTAIDVTEPVGRLADRPAGSTWNKNDLADLPISAAKVVHPFRSRLPVSRPLSRE
ncbi:unnamed protein product [Soboliphyme baturini]|uniref:BAT2_N domain-containing protein n=1 Tax=Soboliphyme baturini TaxID=241478 RepID=A0A183IKU0_9BILA|nr:unnamed protein product [Soboliphyme baturini]